MEKEFKPKKMKLKINYEEYDVKPDEKDPDDVTLLAAVGFDYDLYSLDELNIPEASNFELKLENDVYCDGFENKLLKFVVDKKTFFALDYDDVKDDIENVLLCGTISNPYHYIEQGLGVLIYESERYVIIIKQKDIFDEEVLAFKVRKDKYVNPLLKMGKAIIDEEDVI